MITAVTGGRDLVVDQTLARAFWWLFHSNARADEQCTVRHGNCRGLDQWIAKTCALPDWSLCLPPIIVESWPYPSHLGKAGGPIRNRAMLRGSWVDAPGYPVDILFAFPGGRGTADCTRAALSLRIRVVEVRP